MADDWPKRLSATGNRARIAELNGDLRAAARLYRLAAREIPEEKRRLGAGGRYAFYRRRAEECGQRSG